MIKLFTKALTVLVIFIVSTSVVNAATPVVAPPPTTTYYSISNGAFNSNIWSNDSHTGPTCGCAPCACAPCAIPANSIIRISHVVTINCDVSIGSNSTFIIESGGNFTVTGNASISGTGFFQVDAGGSATVTGNFTVSGTGDATINGSLNVGGNLSLSAGAGSLICGSGTISVVGTVTGIPDPCFTGSLPIELLYFEGDFLNNSVDLKWATSSESNNDYFTILRSSNATAWSNLTIVAGAGNSNWLIEYGRVDYNPLSGTSYYKLRQTDYDGNFSESNIVVVQNNSSSGVDIIPFPNPNQGSIIGLEIFGFNDEEIGITITNVLGERIYYNTFPVLGDNYTLSLDLSGALQAGTYFVTGKSEKNTISKKILVK
jgi:hypothetical protein